MYCTDNIRLELRALDILVVKIIKWDKPIRSSKHFDNITGSKENKHQQTIEWIKTQNRAKSLKRTKWHGLSEVAGCDNHEVSVGIRTIFFIMQKHKKDPI